MPDDIIPISKYASHQAEVVADIEARVQELGCQPILFVGSGFSKRYFGGSDNVRSPSRGRVSRSVNQEFQSKSSSGMVSLRLRRTFEVGSDGN